MSLHYNLIDKGNGIYFFTTDSGIQYTAFFTSYQIFDKDGNSHIIYSFGFDRSGKFDSKKFHHEYDEKIKRTIVHIVKEFFNKYDHNALVYFCYPDDEYSRHRSIMFSKWCSEEMIEDIEHLKRISVFNNEKFYGGMLILKSNPLRIHLVNAVSYFIDDLANQKYG
ncbi:DUF6169 family protein [Pedobacter heparinus]|uniref:DUF6169 family protein n=1 Tax=Pedobacter heparinus TaxID=984 RepID=UPI00292EA3A1|nr:DUF6169 family protein [Pedobacter heparinus]